MFNKIVTILVIASSAVMLPVLPGCQAGGCGCPPLWTSFQSNCYRYFSVKNITWHGAEMHCSGFSVPCSDVDSTISLGHLTSIHSKEEMTFLSVLYESIRSKVITSWTRVWIGLHDQATEASWEWSDGSSLDYEIWDSGQPNSLEGNQDCAEFHWSNEYTWNDLACDTDGDSEFVARAYLIKNRRSFAAKMFNKIVTILIIGSSAVMLPVLPGCQAEGCGCPPLWTAFQSNCYRYFSVKNITWHEAEKHCSGFSVPCSDVESSLGHLTSIHSKAEMDFLSVLHESLRSKVVTSTTYVWIGLHDQTTEASWEWSDGSSLDYEIWKSGQPNSYGGNQDCTVFGPSSKWSDFACDSDGDGPYHGSAYVCKLPQW